MTHTSEIRKDYIQEAYVIIAPRRGKRPHDIVDSGTHKKRAARRSLSCVFCPGSVEDNNHTLMSVKSEKHGNTWDIMVFANKFPAVSLNNPRAYGQQEVVVETPNHNISFHELPEHHIAKVLEVYAHRTKTISENRKIEYILIFKNEGWHAGASIEHTHSQIFATSFLPPHLLDKSQKVQEYKLKHGRCVYCDVIKKESSGPRLIYQDRHVMAFAPYASMYNYECWIMPMRHIDNITLLTREERLSWAKILKHILKKITKLHLPYNYYFHQVVHDEDQHLYMKIIPRGSIWAGVEIGSGIVINPIAPEEAARYYKK